MTDWRKGWSLSRLQSLLSLGTDKVPDIDRVELNWSAKCIGNVSNTVQLTLFYSKILSEQSCDICYVVEKDSS